MNIIMMEHSLRSRQRISTIWNWELFERHITIIQIGSSGFRFMERHTDNLRDISFVKWYFNYMLEPIYKQIYKTLHVFGILNFKPFLENVSPIILKCDTCFWNVIHAFWNIIMLFYEKKDYHISKIKVSHLKKGITFKETGIITLQKTVHN